MDVSFLSQVLAEPGPFATVCADVSHTTQNADAELELRVRAVVERLTEQGAPQATVDATRARLMEGADGGEAGTLRGRAVVTDAHGTVLLDLALLDAPRREVAEWSELPDLLPILRQVPGRVPHVVAVVDRVGADLSIATLPGHPDLEESVDGESQYVHKVRGGGWAHRRFQNTTEDVWRQNASGVAQEIDHLVSRSAARFLLVAGEVRARAVLVDQLSDRTRSVLVETDDGGRADGADREAVDRRAAELVAEREAREEHDVIEQIEGGLARKDAVVGLADVSEALRKAQVQTLVLCDDPGEEQMLVGPAPLELAATADELAAMGVSDSDRVPADRALIRATVGGGADVVVLPSAGMPGGVTVAALLRFTDA